MASAVRFLAGAALAGIYMPGVRIVAASMSGARRGFAVGAYVAAFYLGSAVSVFITALLLPDLGWRGAAVALGLIGIAALPAAWLGLRGVRIVAGGSPRLDLSVLRQPGLLRTIAAYTGHGWELFVMRAWFPAFLAAAALASGADSVVQATVVGSAWAAVLLTTGVPFVFLGGWLSDRFGRRQSATAIAAASGAIALVLGFLVSAPWPLILAVSLVYVAIVGADSAIYSTSVTELAHADRVGSAQGVQAFLGFGAGAVGPVLAGAALDVGLGYAGVFIVAGVPSLLAAAVLITSRRELALLRSGEP